MRAEFLVQVQRDLTVRARPEQMSAAPQFASLAQIDLDREQPAFSRSRATAASFAASASRLSCRTRVAWSASA
jgi:hypothetical protein